MLRFNLLAVCNMSSSLFLCLYTRSDNPGDYHWALTPRRVEPDDDVPYNPANIFQIDLLYGTWFTEHKSVHLTHTSRFIGCIKLPTIHMDFRVLWDCLDAHSATAPYGYSFLHGVEWSCAEWVIELLRQLQRGNYIGIELQGFKERVNAAADHMRVGNLGTVNQGGIRVYAHTWL